jgi:tetratricopeptide (TPR) repeat protein
VSLWRLLIEKLPLVAFAVVSSVVTTIAQQRLGAVRSMDVLPFEWRITNALGTYVAYLGKYFWPERLAVFYPHPAGALPVWQVVGAAAILIAVSAVVAVWARRRPHLAVGWCWYLGMLVPVIGLVQVGSQGMADRYTYLPMIGITIAVVWSVAGLVSRFSRWWWRRAAVVVACGVLLIVLVTGTRRQLAYWRNNLTLFERALRVTTDNALAHYHVGVALKAQGRLDEAERHYAEALRIKPHYVDAHVNLGVLLAGLGRWDGAVSHYTEALRLQPESAEAHNNFGVALAWQQRLKEAAAHFEAALRIRPDYVEAHNNLGQVLAGLGRIDAAIDHLTEALRLRPDFSAARQSLTEIVSRQSRAEEAAITH